MTYSLRRRIETLFWTFPDAQLHTIRIANICGARDVRNAHVALMSLRTDGIVETVVQDDRPEHYAWRRSPSAPPGPGVSPTVPRP